MARYRVGINLALPAFDTYGCLEKFARNPHDRAARLAYWRLRGRARKNLLYDAYTITSDEKRVRALISIRTGISMDELKEYLLPDADDDPIGFGDLGKLDAEGRQRLFDELCRIHGVVIDRSDSMSFSDNANIDV